MKTFLGIILAGCLAFLALRAGVAQEFVRMFVLVGGLFCAQNFYQFTKMHGAAETWSINGKASRVASLAAGIGWMAYCIGLLICIQGGYIA